MKMIVFSLLALCFSLSLKAQSILSIPFGSSYQTTKECLESRFGSNKVFEDGGKIEVMNPVIGGQEFKAATFYFQRQGSATWMNEVFIQTWFSTTDTENAKFMRDEIAEILAEKYEIKSSINNQGFKVYTFGTNPKNKDEALGSLFITKDKGNDGKARLYLILYYGPIYYINKSSDF